MSVLLEHEVARWINYERCPECTGVRHQSGGKPSLSFPGFRARWVVWRLFSRQIAHLHSDRSSAIAVRSCAVIITDRSHFPSLHGGSQSMSGMLSLVDRLLLLARNCQKAHQDRTAMDYLARLAALPDLPA